MVGLYYFMIKADLNIYLDDNSWFGGGLVGKLAPLNRCSLLNTTIYQWMDDFVQHISKKDSYHNT